VAGRIGWLLSFFRRAEPRGAPPSGWALVLDAAVAVGAAAGAVYEMTRSAVSQPGGAMSATVSGSPAAVRHALQVGLPLDKLGHPVLTGPVHASLLMLAAAALTALPLAVRRLYPITAWLVIIAAMVAVHKTLLPASALYTAVYAAYSAIAHSRYRNLAVAVVSVTTVFVASVIGNQLPRFTANLTAIFAIAPAAAAGLGIRVLRRRLADSAARLRRAADEAAAATERALAAERARIASELHDVVTHNVSVMIVQAGAARKIMASSRVEAEDALLAVEATGREAMTELRNLLGLLSPAADGTDAAARDAAAGVLSPGMPTFGVSSAGVSSASVSSASVSSASTVATAIAPTAAREAGGAGTAAAALRPQPGLGELDALIGRVSAAGLPVELRVSGESRPLPPGADLAAYRVVQEGLTNVLRHAGPTAATVSVEWGEELVITVSDDGDSSGPGDGNGGGNGTPGRGLLGLRERLALYGGELAAGPRPCGGWQVRAIMPTGAVS
jgi:signal transduction histidine kinase